MFIETALDITNNPGNPLNAVLAGNYVGACDEILENHRPSEITDFLEGYWRQGIGVPTFALGVPPAQIIAHQNLGRPTLIDFPPPPALPVPQQIVGWHHLVYAYLLENTRIYDIFRRVISEYAFGERLPRPTPQTLRWLRNTEELFLSSPHYLSARSVTSNIRPDDGAVRRNLYQRALGMDLNHGTDDGRPYQFTKSDIANKDFVVLWEALLAEVWKGFGNRLPAFASTATADPNAMQTLVRRIQEMLLTRRFSGSLSREEFFAVACMSWLRLVVSDNTQIVTNLTAQAAGEADRLKQIGILVGLSAHSRSDAYFQLAQPMSAILREIENGAVTVALNANGAALYADLSPYQQPMLDIITHWSVATGRSLKELSGVLPPQAVLTEISRTTAVGTRSLPVPRAPLNVVR